MRFELVQACILVPALIISVACSRQQIEGKGPDNILAVVNGEPVTEDDLAMVLDVHGRRQSPEARREAVSGLIDRELLYQRGLELGLDKDAKYRDMVRIMEMRLREASRAEMARRVMSTQIASRVAVSEEDVRRYYEKHEEQITTEVRLLIVNVPDEQAGQRVLERVRTGQTFEKAAAEQPLQPLRAGASARDSGFLPWNQVPAEWADAIYGLEADAVSTVLNSRRTGACIVKLIEKRKNKDAAFDRMSASIMTRLRDQRVQDEYDRYVADLRNRAKIIKDERRNAS